MSPRAALLALLGLLLLAAPAAAQAPQPLVYVMVIDGLDGDSVDEGHAPFIASLLRGDDGSRATYYRESRSIMVAETNPNHVAMATGAYAELSGIPGNAFAVHGVTDGESCPQLTHPAAIPEETSGQSPDCLLAETFFGSIQRSARANALVTAGIFGKPKLARIFAGRKVTDGRYDADYLWTPCQSETDGTPYCKHVPSRPNDGYSLFDRDVMDEVLRTVREGVPADGRTFTGSGARPDLTFVNLPGVDSAGHASGRGATYDATVGSADDEIERFVAQQKQLGLWGRSVLVLLSDHSMETSTERTSLSLRFGAAGIPASDYRIVQNGSAAFVYVTDRSSPERFALLKQLRDAARGTSLTPGEGPPAAEALYREPNPVDGGAAKTVAARHPAWRLAGSDRTGDLIVTARPGGVFNEPNPLTGNHGGPQTRDNFFAVIGGGPLVVRQAIASAQDPLFDDTERNPGQAENVDVAPTVARLLSEPAPAQSQGRFLAEAFDPAQLPVALAPGGAAGPAACASAAGFRSVAVRPSRGGLRFGFQRRAGARPVSVDVFQASIGRRILGSRRIAHFSGRRRAFRWSGRRARAGQLFARLRTVAPGGRADVRRIALVRRGGRFHRRPGFARRPSCGAITAFTLARPVFGGRKNSALGVSYRLRASGRTTVELLRGSRRVRRLGRTRVRGGGRTQRLRVAARGLRRGDYRIRVTVRSDGRRAVATLTARRL